MQISSCGMFLRNGIVVNYRPATDYIKRGAAAPLILSVGTGRTVPTAAVMPVISAIVIAFIVTVRLPAVIAIVAPIGPPVVPSVVMPLLPVLMRMVAAMIANLFDIGSHAGLCQIGHRYSGSCSGAHQQANANNSCNKSTKELHSFYSS